MKRLKWGALLCSFCAVTMGAICLPAARVSAAVIRPEIELTETGAENEYKVTVRGLDSTITSVQFDIALGGAATAKMEWADSARSTFGEVLSEGGKLTFYYDKTSPLTNSSDAFIGNLTVDGLNGDASFSTSGTLKAVTGRFEELSFDQVPLRVTDGGEMKPDPDPKPDSKPDTGLPASSDESQTGNRKKDKTSASLSSTEAPMVSWDAVKKNVKTADGRKSLTIDMRRNPKIPAALLKNLAQEGIAAVFDYGDYQWIIDGRDAANLPANRLFYNLAIRSLHYGNVSAAANQTDIVQFEILYDGILPFRAVLRYPLGAQYAGKTVYLSQYRDDEGTLTLITSARADENGTVELPFEHASKYVLTAENLWDAQEDAAADVSSKAIPQTGGVIRVPPLGGSEAGGAQDGESVEAKAREITSDGESGAKIAQATAPAAQDEKQSERDGANPERGVLFWVALAVAVLIVFILAAMRITRRSAGKHRI